ncbi:MAG: fenitrothion hydrolase [Solirubrobacterales bacterium]|nr:fenitrothion hydrolase [Solirubrobacterales bacterium]
MLGSIPVRIACGAVGLFLLGLAIYAGLEGTTAPDRNIALTLIYVTAWLGFPVLGVLFGDLFAAFNPWKAIATPAALVYRRLAGRAPSHLGYPRWLGRWPAAVGLVAFVWLELIYGQGSDVAVGLSPDAVARAAIFYSVYTLSMTAVFGRQAWFKNGEIFSVYFGMFGSLGKLAFRDGVLGSRRLLSGSSRWVAGTGSVAVVIASIGTTTFDGAQEGVFKDGIERLIEWSGDIGLGATASVRFAGTTFMLISIALVALVYLLGIRGMATVPGGPDRRRLWRGMGHALIPIALAYLVAHYFSLFVFQEQAQFTYLLSDPLGTGTTDLFGTAGSGIDYGVIGSDLIWYVQVAVLIAGHVAGLMLAHDRAIAYWNDYRLAARSQYWMLAMMVAFTCFGLFLLSVSNA